MKRWMAQWTLLVILFVVMAGPGVMQAAPLQQSSTLDQDNENDTVSQSYSGYRRQAQTFIAGRSGLLDRIELEGIQHAGGGQIDVQITSVNQDGTPTGTVFGSGSFDSSELPPDIPGDWTSVPINPPVQMTSGVQYAIVLSQDTSDPFAWRATQDYHYSGGKNYFYDSDASEWTVRDEKEDYFFRTYVLTLPPPTCFGQNATISVKDGKVVGGPDTGKTYKGKLKGTKGNDVIIGTEGKDTLEGSDGNDLICGLGGTDTIHGNDGNDRIDGGSSNDIMYGDDGTDTLIGGDGNDRLFGAAGPDTLTGGAGADYFNGGSNTDTATDYNAAQGDTKESIP